MNDMNATRCNAYRPQIPLAYQPDRINWRAIVLALLVCALLPLWGL